MKNMRDDVKTFIVIVSVCIICVVIILIMNIKSNTDKLQLVDEYNVFFSNTSYVNTYINYISNNDNIGVYSLLDKKYIEDNYITYDNVFDNIDNYSKDSLLKVTSMSYVQIGDNFVYYLKGKVYKNNYNSQVLIDDNFSIVIKTDYESLSYSLYPVDNNYKNVINSIKKYSIINNEYNGITKSELITKEQVCSIYMSDFSSNLVNNIEEAYNSLSDNTKEIYSNVSDYEDYVNDNYELFSGAADKCALEEIDDKRVYTVIDSNGSVFTFVEESVMNYKVDFSLKKVNE